MRESGSIPIMTFLKNLLKRFMNSVFANVPILYPLKAPEKLQFFMFSGGIKWGQKWVYNFIAKAYFAILSYRYAYLFAVAGIWPTDSKKLVSKIYFQGSI